MANVFARGSIVARSERIQRIANAVHVVEKFAEQAAPGLRLGERVVRGQTEATRNIALQMQHERVVAGAVVGVKNVHAGHDGLLVDRVGGGNQRSEKIVAAAITVSTVAMIALLVRVVSADRPVFIEGMLNAPGNVDGVKVSYSLTR